MRCFFAAEKPSEFVAHVLQKRKYYLSSLVKLNSWIDRNVEKDYNKFSLLNKGVETITQQSCCIVGDRLLPRRQTQEIADLLEQKILKLVSLGVTRFFTGGALGFDTFAAQVVLRLRDEHPEIRHILVLPSPEQSAKWPAPAVAVYESLKSRSNEVICTSDSASRGHIFKCYRFMIDSADYCLCYLAKASGYPAQAVRYAEKTDHVVIRIELA